MGVEAPEGPLLVQGEGPCGTLLGGVKPPDAGQVVVGLSSLLEPLRQEAVERFVERGVGVGMDGEDNWHR